MMAPPQAEAIPHPTIKGAWTLRDRLNPNGNQCFFASKASAEAAAAARNLNRRRKHETPS